MLKRLRGVRGNIAEMRTITLSNGNINFIFVLMFLITFVILLIIEVTLTTYYKSHALHKPTYTISSERTQKFEEYSYKNTNTLLPRDAVWQPVTGTTYKFYVYSAFLDKRSRKQWVIKVIGATKTKFYDKAICIFHFKDRPGERIRAKVAAIRENWNLPYSAVFIICNIKNSSHIPSSVSISTYNNQYSTNKDAGNNLLVQNHPDLTLDQNKDKIAVCVKPIHYNYDKTVQLLEFIELNRLLGVSHFTFYNSSLSSSTNCILHHYLKEGTVSVHSWHLQDIRSQVEIRTEGMFAALNDCLYRNMYTYPYVAFIDLDEIITPQFNKTLNDLLKWLSIRYNTNQVSAYSFQNAFFYTQWNDDSSLDHSNEIEKHLISIRKTRRCLKLSPHTQRSKYIAKVKNVFEVGNHFVWQFLPLQNVLNVPPKVALLHHYRVCEFGGDGCVHLPSVVDRTLHSYRRNLTCKIAEKWLRLNDRCGLPKLENFNYEKICEK